jgi:hypothetical protein
MIRLTDMATSESLRPGTKYMHWTDARAACPFFEYEQTLMQLCINACILHVRLDDETNLPDETKPVLHACRKFGERMTQKGRTGLAHLHVRSRAHQN